MNQFGPEILELARDDAGERLGRVESNLLELEAGSAPEDAVDSMFRDVHSIKGSAGMVGWRGSSALANAMEDVLERARRQGRVRPELAGALLSATDALRKSVVAEAGEPAGGAAPGQPPPSGPAAAEPSRPSVRVDAEKVDRMLETVGESLLHHRRLEHGLAQRIALRRDLPMEEELSVGERLLDELREVVLGMRMLPLSAITAGYPRAVRDLAAEHGKEVELEIAGAETELDRVVLEAVSDPIVHLLRNAVAHGIETPRERERAGKPRGGRVELRAEPRGGMVAVRVADDGRGVPAELLERGRERGSVAEVLAEAGVSTARALSDVAGRGVGLDAVSSQVKALGGSLEVRSEPGRGTEVILLLPLTLVLLEVMLVERGGRVLGLPLTSVAEVARVEGGGDARFVELHGERVPAHDLAALIASQASELPDRTPAVVLTSPAGRMAVACDELLGRQEVVTMSLGPLLSHLESYLGAAILGDGRVALICDPNFLISASGRERAPAAPLPESPIPPPPERKRRPPSPEAKLLVVDDERTVRTLERSILEAAGYRVETSENGAEALERLAADEEIALILCDLELPEKDGFELLAAIRSDPDRSGLPVIVITARTEEEDRRRAAEVGADAYIVKQSFDQRALLECVARLLER